MTLDQSTKGMEIEIVGIGNEAGRSQLIRFGISEGTRVTCTEKFPKGPVILGRKRQEIAVGHELARTITVARAVPEVCADRLSENHSRRSTGILGWFGKHMANESVCGR